MADWWRSGVVYQLYPRSFADSDGDGVGDLRGVTERLDHLADLGVDAVWLNPCFPSPNADWGYDVADYLTVAPELGGDAALDELIAAAGERRIRILLDLVPNHTSNRHPWFEDARSSRDATHRDWYVWADGRDGGPPNNWKSVFGGPAWTLDEATGQWFLHNFLPEQPDLNWWNEDVRAAFDGILRHWFDRGVAGFRIDVAHAIVKDAELRDNPAADESDPPRTQRFGQRQVYSMNRPEVHDVFRRWRGVAQEYDPERVLLGETWVFELERLARFYGESSDELHLAFNIPFLLADFEAETLAEIVAATEAALGPADAWPVWTLSNHDVIRFPTRWCADHPARIRCALVLLLTLRGTPVLYYGDEVGMPQARLARSDLRDPVGLRHWPLDPGRDGARTPLPWADEPGAGFTGPGVQPWLPIADAHAVNVASQRDDPDSVLSLARNLIALRRELDDLATGAYERLPSPPGTWAWRRGERVAVAVNATGLPQAIGGTRGPVRVATDRARDGEEVAGGLHLDAWGAAVVAERGPHG